MSGESIFSPRRMKEAYRAGLAKGREHTQRHHSPEPVRQRGNPFNTAIGLPLHDEWNKGYAEAFRLEDEFRAMGAKEAINLIPWLDD